MTPTATVARPSSRRAWARTCVVVPHVLDCVWLSFFSPWPACQTCLHTVLLHRYRKHFVLPSDWQGTHIELYTEGVYASATFYLNGIVLGSHQVWVWK